MVCCQLSYKTVVYKARALSTYLYLHGGRNRCGSAGTSAFQLGGPHPVLQDDDTPPVKGEPHHGRRLSDMEIRGAMLIDLDMQL